MALLILIAISFFVFGLGVGMWAIRLSLKNDGIDVYLDKDQKWRLKDKDEIVTLDQLYNPYIPPTLSSPNDR